jgi:hypothetical protein
MHKHKHTLQVDRKQVSPGWIRSLSLTGTVLSEQPLHLPADILMSAENEPTLAISADNVADIAVLVLHVWLQI